MPVTFESKRETQLEYYHNLIALTRPEESREYNSEQDAMVMARLINDLNNKEGTSSAQQCLLTRGIKVFGQKCRDAVIKEIDQLRHGSYFTPIYIAK